MGMYSVVFCKNAPYLCKFKAWLEICINQRAVLFRNEGDSVFLRVRFGAGARWGVDGEVRAIHDSVVPDFVSSSRNVEPFEGFQPVKREIVDDPALFRQIQLLKIDAALKDIIRDLPDLIGKV